MFGRHRREREENRLNKQKMEFNQQKQDFAKNTPQREREEFDLRNELASQKAQQAKSERKNAFNEGITQGEEFFKKDIEGLNPQKRKALQYEASRNLDRGMETANRKLLGDQSQRGIVGKGGVGYAQQRELQRMAMDAQGGIHRDLDKLDADLKNKNRAALFGIGQGEAAQTALDRQLAADELQLDAERKRQRTFEDQFNRLFSRV